MLERQWVSASEAPSNYPIGQLREPISLRANPADWEGIPATRIDSEDYNLSGRRAGFSQGVEQVLVIPATSDTATRAEAFSMSRDTSQLQIRFVGRRTDDGYILEGRIGTLKKEFPLPWI